MYLVLWLYQVLIYSQQEPMSTQVSLSRNVTIGKIMTHTVSHIICPGHQRTARAVSGGEEDYPLILIEEGLSFSLLPISLRASVGNYMSDFQRQSVDSLKIQQALAGVRMCLDASKWNSLSLLWDISTIWGVYAWVVATVPWRPLALIHLTADDSLTSLFLCLKHSTALTRHSLASFNRSVSLRHLKGLLRWEIIDKINAISCINTISVCVCAEVQCYDKHTFQEQRIWCCSGE